MLQPGNNGDTRRLMGEAEQMLRGGRVNDAVARLQHILAQDPEHAPAAAMLGAIALQNGRPADAISLLEQAAKAEPRNPDTLANLGLAHCLSGQVADGKDALQRAIDIRADHVNANYNLGLIAMQEGAFADARGLFARVLRSHPKHADATMNLGIACLKTGDPEGARRHLKRAVDMAPQNPVARLNYANALVETGKPDEALGPLEQLATAHPQVPDVQFGLAKCHEKRGNAEGALAAYRKTVELDPDNGEAHLSLGRLLLDMSRWGEAEQHARRAAEILSNDIEPQLNLAALLAATGREDEGFALFDRVLAAHPGSATALAALAAAQQASGRFAAARETIARLEEADPENPAAIHLRASDGGLAFGDAEYAKIDRLTSAGKVSGIEAALLELARARALDRAGRHEEAFAAAATANAIRAEALDYDAAAYEERTAQLETYFDKDAFARHADFATPSGKPVFVIGMPRSGTSLIERILASHSQVYGAGELRHFQRFSTALPHQAGGIPYPKCLDRITAAQAQEMAAEYLGFLDRLAPDATHVTDKMPDNFWHVGLIHLLLPEAKFIYCVRDPRDTCVSIFFESFSGYHGYAVAPDRLGHFFGLHQRIMSHWRGLGMPIHDCDYARLLDDPSGETARMLEFLELPWEDGCLDFQNAPGPVMTASRWQVRQPLFKSSLGRWRHYERHLGPLIEALERAGVDLND